MPTMSDAWAKFDEAVKWEEKIKEPGKDGNPKTDKVVEMTLRQANKKLDEAIALEAEVLAESGPQAQAA